MSSLVIVVDFDETITTKDTETFETRSINDIIYDHATLTEFIHECNDNKTIDIRFIIASFAYKPTIIKYMVQLSNLPWGDLGDLVRNKDGSPAIKLAITTPRDYYPTIIKNSKTPNPTEYDETSVLKTKTTQLNAICRILGAAKDCVYFFDDNEKNIQSAKDAGYKNSFLVLKGKGFIKTIKECQDSIFKSHGIRFKCLKN